VKPLAVIPENTALPLPRQIWHICCDKREFASEYGCSMRQSARRHDGLALEISRSLPPKSMRKQWLEFVIRGL
jgi:hypothetical protein